MTARSSRYRTAGRPRRTAVFSLATLAALVGTAWLLPSVLVHTSLRDRPLEAAFAGIVGNVSSRAATWRWVGGIEYRDVSLADASGRTVVAVPRIVIERGLLALLFDPRNLGTVRIVGGDALVEVRAGGSTIEDVLAPWLATLVEPTAAATSFDLEVLDGAVELVDVVRHDAWRVVDLAVAGRVVRGNAAAGWAVSGRVLHAGEPLRDRAAGPGAGPAAALYRRDRATIAAAATAALARDGGWTVSAPEAAPGDAFGQLAIACNRLPLGVSSVWATRFAAPYLAAGIGDVRLDVALPLAEGGGDVRVAGTVAVRRFALCDAATLGELFVVDECEAPLDISVGDLVSVRTLKASSPLFTAEASGRIGIPRGSVWRWGDALVAGDFAVAATIDLAAAARATPGGLRVRDDVRVMAGQLQLSASAHGDGADRVLELRASARDLAAVQGERQLRWNDPFSAWLRGRRSAGRDARLLIEEAHLASSAAEVSAAGGADALAIQWSVDLEKLVAEIAEVIDLEGTRIAGVARGRVDVGPAAESGGSTARLSASFAQFSCAVPGVPEWRDDEIALEAEGSGSFVADAAVVDACRVVLRSGDDRLELVQTGRALVNPAALRVGGPAGREARAVVPAPQSEGVTADVSLAGDLGRWQARWTTVARGVGSGQHWPGWRLGGRVKEASAAIAITADGWQVTRAGVEVEKFTGTGQGRQVVEPRIVATGAGAFDPASGVLTISSAEVLTATLSLRTGGLSLAPAAPTTDAVERLRGRLQWQADVARLEKWLVPLAVAEAWPAAGRAWGTLEIIDTPAGTNLLFETTGDQVSLARGPAASQPMWAEPRMRVVVEVTREGAAAGSARLLVNRVAIDSATLALEAAGTVEDPASRRLVTLAGTATYDWELLSRLVAPWTGGRVRLAGGGRRPIMLRAPLESIVQAVLPAAPAAVASAADSPAAARGDTAEVSLPDDWLSTMRRRDDGGQPGKIAPAALPQARERQDAGEWVRHLSATTTAAWTAADVDGFTIDPGTVEVRLFEGQLAFGPFDLAASGGRLRGAPWIRLLPPPGELVVPPGRLIDRVPLSSRFCEEWVSWVTPLVGRSTRTQGVASVDVAGARVPLGDPFGGELSGQIVFENTEVTPGPQLGPLATLMVKLQTLVDPRFAFGDKVVLLRVRPDPVRMRLADRRLWHEGLVMDMGQLVVRSAGSVGADGSLAMTAEVAFRGDIAGSTPVLGQLMRTPLIIPLKGTVARPQFDAGAIDAIVGRIVENTAEAVIKDGLSRGLEQLFGSPPAPAP